ncbi:MAG TPA: cytochrome c [Chitinophagales bacterium]|nr:cytochrome c [Chitinophagales bacterium]
MRKQVIKLIPVAALALILVSCGRDPKKPGRIYMPDMTYSNAYETYAPSEIPTAAGYDMSARQPVAGTVPYYFIPDDSTVRSNPYFLMSYVAKNHYTHDPAKWQEEFDRAGKEIKNPLPYTDENLAEGKRLYEINCTPCHGEKGDGNGQLVQLPNGNDGPFASHPPDYKSRLPQENDGNIFYVVSYGKNMMGGYGFQLSVKERWQVIHYIKSMAGITGDDNGPGGAATAAQPEKATKKKG